MGYRYLRMQLKRALGTAVHLLGVALLLALSVVLAGAGLANRDRENREPMTIAVTGAVEDRYLQKGLGLIRALDSSRFSLRFVPMEEETARRAVRSGEAVGYIRVPEGFTDAVRLGDRLPVTYVCGSADVSAVLAREIAEAVAVLQAETENAIYGVQRYAWETDPESDWYGESMRLFDRYLADLLDRSSLFAVEIIGVSRSLSLAGGMFFGLLLLTLMLWHIGAAPFFNRRSGELGAVLRGAGVPWWVQVGAEYLVFLLMSAAGAAFLPLLGAAALRVLGQPVKELRDLLPAEAAGIFLRSLPAILPVSAMSFFLYTAFPGAVGSAMALFLNAAAQGYAAGCLYPSSFLPEAVRRIGDILPAGAALRWLSACVTGEDAGAWIPVLLWTAVCLALSVFLRSRGREAAP